MNLVESGFSQLFFTACSGKIIIEKLNNIDYKSGKKKNPTMAPPVILEVCIDSLASLHAAVKGGAHRIELCASLAEGGLTPTLAMLRRVKQSCDVPV